jgi:hypothetical protein
MPWNPKIADQDAPQQTLPAMVMMLTMSLMRIDKSLWEHGVLLHPIVHATSFQAERLPHRIIGYTAPCVGDNTALFPVLK